MRGVVALVASAIGFVVFLVIVLSTYYTVGQSERVVVTHFGRVAGVSEPGGPYFIWPIGTDYARISVAAQVVQYGGSDDNKFAAYSKDQQPADLQIVVNWRVIDPSCVFANYASNLETLREQVIDPKVYEYTKNIFGGTDAVDAIRDRASLNGKVQWAIQSAVNRVGACVHIEAVQIKDIAFSQKYENAVEDQMEATVREKQVIAQKNQRITAADAAAYEVTAAADASAHATRVAGQAEADAIKAKGDALRDNPGVPALIIANKWNGVLPTTMPPNGSVPMLHLPGGN